MLWDDRRASFKGMENLSTAWQIESAQVLGSTAVTMRKQSLTHEFSHESARENAHTSVDKNAQENVLKSCMSLCRLVHAVPTKTPT